MAPTDWMIMDGFTTSDARWVACERYFADNWTSWLPTRMYGLYAFVKAMRLALPDEVETFSSDGFNWYRGSDATIGLAQQLVNTQLSDGRWNGTWVQPPLATAWAIIMLVPELFQPPPDACYAANPNPTFPDVDITFDPSCSDHLNPEKDIDNLVLFEWDWNNDGDYDESTTDPDEVTHAFPCAVIPCTFPVTLKVTDDNVDGDGNPARSGLALSLGYERADEAMVSEPDGPRILDQRSSRGGRRKDLLDPSNQLSRSTSQIHTLPNCPVIVPSPRRTQYRPR